MDHPPEDDSEEARLIKFILVHKEPERSGSQEISYVLQQESEGEIHLALEREREQAARFAQQREREQAARFAQQREAERARFALLQENERQQEQRKSGVRFQWSLLQTLLLLFFPWTVKVYEQLQYKSFGNWGLQPGTAHGLWGLLTMPFLHKDFDHLSHNSFGLLILGMGLFYFYPRVAWPVLVGGSVIPALLVWCFGSPGFHIGASGVVYALSAFLFFSGVWRRDRASRGGALIVALLYGGSIWGIFPLQEGISWEGHFFGALVGCYLSVLFRDVDLPPVVQISDDKENQDDEVSTPYWMESEPETDSERGPVP